jgi:hypothetical protein
MELEADVAPAKKLDAIPLNEELELTHDLLSSFSVLLSTPYPRVTFKEKVTPKDGMLNLLQQQDRDGNVN